MNVPRFVKIHETKIFIKFSEMSDWGEYFPDLKEIHLSTRLLNKGMGDELKKTLFHELQHAVFDITGISTVMNHDGKLEEAIVVCNENILFPLIEKVFYVK